MVGRCVNTRRIEGSVKVVEGDVDDPYPVKVDQKVGKGAFLIVGFKKDLFPFNLTEFHVTLGRWDVDEPLLYTHIREEERKK